MELFVAVATMGGLLGIVALAYASAYRRENRPDRILAILYHRILSREEYDSVTPATERIFTIPEQSFRAQMQYLRDHGYHPVSPEAVLDYVEHGATLPEKPVLITFDDGCESVYSRALPILQEFRFPALFFVTTNPDSWIFRYGNAAQRLVTANEIRELDDAGVTIGSHGVSHEALEAMTEEEIEYDLGESKRVLEEILDKSVDTFGVPLNWYGTKVREAAQRLGYRAVFTSDNGTIHGDSDPYHLRRFIIEGSFTIEEFARNLKAGSIVQRRIINLAKRIPARLLGPRIWMPLREKLFASPLRHLFPLRVLKRVLAASLAGAVLALGFAVYSLAR